MAARSPIVRDGVLNFLWAARLDAESWQLEALSFETPLPAAIGRDPAHRFSDHGSSNPLHLRDYGVLL